ncbi:MAG: response regulator [Kiritimatiellae bacterium]|nr:response regulator [Kiritimatiellia bacterium]
MGRRCVLVVDDELGPRESLRILLKQRYDVIAVDSVPAAIEAMRQRRPDLIISDIRMPGMNGIEGLRKFRELDPDVAVIMLTGYADLATARAAMQLGATDYVSKPFDVDEMLHMVERGVETTDRRRARAAAAEELQRLNEELQRRIEENRRLAVLGMTSAQMVHDISNPLTIVIGYLDLLNLLLDRNADGPARQEAREYIESIRSNLRHCTEVLQSWRSLGNKGALRLEPISVKELLSTIVRDARSPGTSTLIELSLEGDAANITLVGDRVHLRRAVENIVRNAIQAVEPGGGRVRVTATREGRELVVTVEDNGCGIAPEDLPRVFDPFFTKGKGERGTGLGLFIARQVAEDHGGRIDIASRLGEGTRVSVRLPMTQ